MAIYVVGLAALHGGGGGQDKVLPWRRRTCGARGTPVTAHPAGPALCVRPSVAIPHPCLAVRLSTGTAEGSQRWWDRGEQQKVAPGEGVSSKKQKGGGP